MAGETVISAPAEERADKIAQGTEYKDQADAFQAAGGVFCQFRQAGSVRGGGESENDEREIVSDGRDIGLCLRRWHGCGCH